MGTRAIKHINQRQQPAAAGPMRLAAMVHSQYNPVELNCELVFHRLFLPPAWRLAHLDFSFQPHLQQPQHQRADRPASSSNRRFYLCVVRVGNVYYKALGHMYNCTAMCQAVKRAPTTQTAGRFCPEVIFICSEGVRKAPPVVGRAIWLWGGVGEEIERPLRPWFSLSVK